MKTNRFNVITISTKKTDANDAATIASYTRDIERFEGDFKRFSSYLGVVPGVHNPADTVRLRKITKRGSQDLRIAFVQVALGIIRQP